MTQFEQAQNTARELQELLKMGEGVLFDLGEILAHAQNAPPHGGSDGTISPEHYNKLRALQSAFEGVKLHLRVLPR